jgi:hypothetical protein
MNWFMRLIASLFGWRDVDDDVIEPPIPPVVPVVEPPAPEPPPPPKYLWNTAKNAYHSTRVIADEMGLTYTQKNILCACIYQESRFLNTAVGYNRNKDGKIISTDLGGSEEEKLGMIQVNDFWHIGPGKTFPSEKYVVDNPEKMVRWMISMYKIGKLNLWVSYSSGAYKQWLTPASPMWKLAS